MANVTKSTSAGINAALTTDRKFDHGKRARAARECCRWGCKVGWLGIEEKAVDGHGAGDGSRFVTSRPVFWFENNTEKVCKTQKTGKTRM